jgi:hypothetical protein
MVPLNQMQHLVIIKKIKMKNLKLLVFLLLSLIKGYSQKIDGYKTADVKPEIKVIAKAQTNAVLLRWGVTRADVWRKLNKYGYTIERYTLTQDNKTLSTPEKIILVQNLKPDPLNNWGKIVETSDNGAIMAQSLYGETFSVEGLNKIEQIVSVSEENEQRFTYALFAADRDFEVAQKAGLGYVDNTVKSNEKYVYRIISNVPENEMVIPYGGVFIGLSDYETLPKPIDLTVHFENNKSILSWDFKSLSSVYGSYFIERSLDKKKFERIVKKPYTSMNLETSNTIFYIDSIANNINYSYRIQGVDIFGENGPYSEIISGKGKDELKVVPHLTIKEFPEDNTAKLTWEFPVENENEISGFEINRSDDDEAYAAIIKNISPKNRSVEVRKLSSSNYFTISAIGKKGSKTTSQSMLVQPVDSIPPAKPLELKGIIDSTGVVKLNWIKNKEKDLLGYRIYRAFNAEEEFSQLTVSPYENNSYQDVVVVENLNSKVFYKIMAVDLRYNMSVFSDVLVLEKPDVIPPTSPVFKNYEVNEGKVYLEWANSSSADAEKLLLYRKESNETDWVLILEDMKKTENYTDSKVVEGNQYSYKMVAKDKHELQSVPSPILNVIVPKASVMPAVKGLYAQVNLIDKNIKLTWSYEQKEADSFEIYRAEVDLPLQLKKTQMASVKFYTDDNCTINTTYKYAVRPLFKDGRMGKMSFYTVKF